MTIDQRLEALTARHEALTQTVELIAGMQRDNEAKLSRNEDQISALTKLIAQDAENIRALARIAEAHEQRLDEIQGQ